MKIPFVSCYLSLVAVVLISSSAHGQSYYPITYQSGPLTALAYSSSYIRIQVPLERAGHSFSVSWRTVNNGPITTNTLYPAGWVTPSGPGGENAALQSILLYTYAPSPTYTYANGNYTMTYFTAYEWWVNDTTASQKSPLRSGTPGDYNGTSVTYSGILSGPWIDVGTSIRGYYAISDSRLGHSIISRDGSAYSSLAHSGYSLNTYSGGTSGTTVPLHWFTMSTSGAANSATAFLVDLDGGARVAAGVSDARAATQWLADPQYASYPILDTNVTLNAREAGHRFAVHRKATYGAEISQVLAAQLQPGTPYAKLSFPVGKGLKVWITREAENGYPVAPVGASATGSSWVATAQGGTFSAISPNPNLFPAIPLRPAGVFVNRTVHVNAVERAGHPFSVRLGDGYTTTYDGSGQPHTDPATGTSIPSYTTSSIDTWSGQPVTAPLPVHTFDTMVDSRFTADVYDEITGEHIPVATGTPLAPVTGPIDWLTPWVATTSTAPVGPTITLELPFTREDSIAKFARTDLNDPNTGLPYLVLDLANTAPLQNPTDPVPSIFTGSSPISPYSSETFTVTANPTPNVPGSFPLIDLLTGSSGNRVGF